MKNCPECGTPIDHNSQPCPKCGTIFNQNESGPNSESKSFRKTMIGLVIFLVIDALIIVSIIGLSNKHESGIKETGTYETPAFSDNVRERRNPDEGHAGIESVNEYIAISTFDDKLGKTVKLIGKSEYSDGTFSINIAPNFYHDPYSPAYSRRMRLESDCENMITEVIKVMINHPSLVKKNIKISAFGSFSDDYGNSKSIEVLKCYFISETLGKINKFGSFQTKQIADSWNLLL